MENLNTNQNGLDDWEIAYLKRKKEAEDRVLSIKKNIADDFKLLNKEFSKFNKDNYYVNSILVRYSGSGDSGCIDDIEFETPFGVFNYNIGYYNDEPKNNIYLPESFPEELKNLLQDNEIGNRLAKNVEECCYDLLEAHHGGWEINEGQSGEFTFDQEFLDNKKITHQFTKFIEHTDQEDF